MAKLKESAMAYESKQTKNIADLDSVSIDVDLEDDEFEAEDEQGNAKTVKQKVAVIEGERYRVPKSVLKQLKVLLEDNPKITQVRVKKSGQGLNTDYTVIPIV